MTIIDESTPMSDKGADLPCNDWVSCMIGAPSAKAASAFDASSPNWISSIKKLHNK